MVAGHRRRSTAVVSAETSDAAAAHKGKYLGDQAQLPMDPRFADGLCP
jgi:hypothetical protein